jgi:hypothetical protein
LAAGQLYTADPDATRLRLRKAAAKVFVVYAKQPFGGPAQVLKYLGRYTHRVGISEQRMVSFESECVRHAWLNRAAGHRRQVLTLSLPQFAEHFLLHLLPRGIRKIRYFGFFSNRDRGALMAQAWDLVGRYKQSSGFESSVPDGPPAAAPLEPTVQPLACSKCGTGMRYLASDRTGRGPGLVGKRLLECRRILAACGVDPPVGA